MCSVGQVAPLHSRSVVLSFILYGTTPLEPRARTAATVILAAALNAASILPVRRALRVEPMEVSRSE